MEFSENFALESGFRFRYSVTQNSEADLKTIVEKNLAPLGPYHPQKQFSGDSNFTCYQKFLFLTKKRPINTRDYFFTRPLKFSGSCSTPSNFARGFIFLKECYNQIEPIFVSAKLVINMT